MVNVGAGAGSYEPADRYVVAVEPSAAMRAQRATPAVIGVAEALPFDDDSFDAAMATITIHQWPDLERGLRELRRVARGPVVILTFDGPAMPRLLAATSTCPRCSPPRARAIPGSTASPRSSAAR